MVSQRREKKKKRECEIWSVGHLFANTTGGRLVWLVLCNYCKKKEKNSMNCVYFAVWAQNQLRSGNNKQPCHQPYSSQHLFCCPDNAPLYATWRPGGWGCRNPRQLSTWLGDPRVLRPQHQGQLVPRTHPLPCSPHDGH